MNHSDKVIVKNGKALRCGLTTGTCATAAAAAATKMLLTGKTVTDVNVTLPKGEVVVLETVNTHLNNHWAQCGVIKDAGDDPDVTNGMEISAKVCYAEEGVQIIGGKGVGRVTGRGLACAQGEAAINPVPRQMIRTHVTNIKEQYHCGKGLLIEIAAPGGEEIAKKTFNERIGIVDGISILGTTGIVEPMSQQALIDTITLCIDKACYTSKEVVLITPGNYGRDYCQHRLGINLETGVKCSNYIGETLDYLVYKKVKNALLVGHVGKLCKLAAGIMQTHSRMADGRMEVIASHAGMCGGSATLIKKIMNCNTTTEAISLLEGEGLTATVFASVLEKTLYHITYRTKGLLHVEVIMFSEQDTVIAKTDHVEALAEKLREMKD